MNLLAKVAIGTLTYNDVFGLSRLIESTRGYVNFHFIVEGKFPNHPGTSDFSTDFTTQLIESYQNKSNVKDIFHVRIAADEFTMRMSYLKLCEALEVDALLILDSDEYIDCSMTNWKKFYEDVTYLKFHHDSNVYGIVGYWGTDNEKPRLWINPDEMTYIAGSHRLFKNKNHDDYLDQDGCMQMSKRKITSIRFIHDSSYRNPQRKEDHDHYFRWIAKHEGDIADNRSRFITP